MMGAIAGDIIGSVYEHSPVKTVDFDLFPFGSTFTDDTVLTAAVADALLRGRDYADAFEDFYYKYPNVPYGARFHDWARAREHAPYNSWGNGSAMRVSPIAHARDDLEEVVREAARSAAVTHDHEEGVRGAEAVAASVFLAWTGGSKADVRDLVSGRFGYDLSRPLDEIRPEYVCDLSCRNTVPQAVECFLESESFESCVRNAVSLGGDADTMACIAGSIAEPFYGGVPEAIRTRVTARLDERLATLILDFSRRYGAPGPH